MEKILKVIEALLLLHNYFIDNKENKIPKNSYLLSQLNKREILCGDWASRSLQAHDYIVTDQECYGNFSTTTRDYTVAIMRRNNLRRSSSH